MKIKVLEGGYAPIRAHFDDAGLDLLCPEHIEIPAHDSALIDLRVSVQIPVGYFGKFESKSGLMTKHHIICPGGVIDSSYRGSLKVFIENHGDEPYSFEPGEKVVQMIVQPCLLTTINITEFLDQPASDRGNNGFGSSGK